MKIPTYEIPEDASAEGRQIVEGINRVIEEINSEVVRNAELSDSEHANIMRRRTLEKSKALLDRIHNLNNELPQYGLEVMEWPETIE